MMALEVAGLRKCYGPVPVLDGVSLAVAPGTLTAVLGTSGAGKTTLLRIVAGFEAADEGTVTLGGMTVDSGRGRVPPERRHIGYVPQDGALFPHLTVGGNVAFALRRGALLARRGHDDGVVAQTLDLVGLADLAGRYPHELSGGQQQRVAIARALASRPRLVLLDEPFAALDASMRATVRADVLGALRATGTTGVLVTHDQDEALSVADCVAVLRDGMITQAGTPESVYATPADPWTAAFVGTANLLPGVLEADGPAGPRVRTALGSHALRAGLTSGQSEVTVLVRPEQVTLTGSLAAGTVTGARYHGHDAMISVDVPGVGPVHARTAGSALPGAGDKVALSVDGPVTAWSR
jgi:iron(III) transport system ATP-binding protein